MRALVILLTLGSLTVVADAPKKAAFKLSADEKELLDLTNAERKEACLGELKANPKLFAAARKHCANMAKQDKLDHTLDDKTLGDRVKAEGYKFNRIGENIAWNHTTPKDAVEGWMKSPGHKANILESGYTEAGLAVAKNAKGERYWIQVFGAPPE